MLMDAKLFIHGTGAAQGAISLASGIYGDTICYSTHEYSALELDFGAPGSASSYPYVTNFPSLAEQAYPAASKPQAETFETGVPWGLHIQIMSAFNTMTSILFDVLTSAATAALYSVAANIIAARTLTLAQMQVVGACYFIPVSMGQVLEFNRFYAYLTGSAPSTGTIIAWYGPRLGATL
jgi:hypothetical protein